MIVTSINNCKEYAWIEGVLYTIDVNNGFCIDDDLVLKGNYSIRGVTNNSIWLFDQLNFETLVYSKQDLILKIAEYGLILKHSLGNDRYIVGLNSGNKILKGIYNLKTLRLERKFEKLGFNGIYLMVDNEFFVSINKQNIALFNLENDLKWQHSFSELIQSENAFLHSRILSSNDKLFFVIDGGENRGLFCIDSNTGKALHKYDKLWYELFQDQNLIYTTMFENTLCKINTESFEVEEWNVNDLIKENGFESMHDHRCVAHDNMFYFTQSLGDNKAKLGVLDWEKKELVYKHDFEPKNGAIGSIQVSKMRMFVHTQDNTLHIFEKE
ncbi:MAG: hypothetical protein GX660_16770 [Clostridiaceae bacterium]|nr:hypothetical protein [Clostridiaceae bacterium]